MRYKISVHIINDIVVEIIREYNKPVGDVAVMFANDLKNQNLIVVGIEENQKSTICPAHNILFIDIELIK